VESSCEFGIEPSGSMNSGKLSIGLTSSGLSSSAQFHIVSYVRTSRWPRSALYPRRLALALPTSGDRSVGVVRSRIEATEFSFLVECRDVR
jgi:hypothetical protein